MDTVNARIHHIIQHYGLSAGEFADRLKIQKSSVSHLLSGRNKPSFQFLIKLLKAFPEINLNWLISGDGDILKNSVQISEYENLKQVENELKDEPQKEIIEPEQKKMENNKESKTDRIENIIMVFNNDTFKILKKS